MTVSDLPAVNATLNSISLILLLIGFRMIRKGNVAAHRTCMVAAFITSILFLTSYLAYRFLGTEKRFGGQGPVRGLYFFILFTHVVLAAAVPFLASATLYQVARGRFSKHRRLARLTFPIWVYVSITGIAVYLLLFRIYGPASAVVGTPAE